MSLMYGRNPSYGSYGGYGRLVKRRPKPMRKLFGTGGLFRKKSLAQGLYASSGRRALSAPSRGGLGLKGAKGVLQVGAQGLAFSQGALKGMVAAAKTVDRKKIRFEFGPGSLMVGLLVVALLLGGTYLGHFNLVATRGYEVTRLQADREQLLNQYEIKNMKLAEVRSLANIAATDRVSAMRRPSSVEFVRGDSAIALK